MEDRMDLYSSLVVARPTALSGFARVLDIAGLFNRYSTSETATEADELAIANDWFVVGETLRQVMSSHESV